MWQNVIRFRNNKIPSHCVASPECLYLVTFDLVRDLKYNVGPRWRRTWGPLC